MWIRRLCLTVSRSRSHSHSHVAVLVTLLCLGVGACGSESEPEGQSGSSTSKAKQAQGTVFSAKTAGKACAVDKDCGNGTCAKQFSDLLGGTQSAPGGYCTFSCKLDADCGEGAACVGANNGGFGFGNTASMSTDGQCLLRCDSSSQCRQGYRCFDTLGQAVESSSATGSAGAAGTCGIAPATDMLPPGVAGGACAADEDCAGGRCMTSDALMTSFPEGYCTGSCLADGDCGDGGVCATSFAGMAGTCYRACETDDECSRDGYRCRAALFPQGAPKRCLPGSEPLPDGIVGMPCVDDVDCGEVARCGLTMPAGMNSELTLPGGYCTGSCVEDLDCGAQGKCIGSFGGVAMGTCYLGCAVDEECREGYVCDSVAFAGFGNFGNFGGINGTGAAMMGTQATVCAVPQATGDQDAGVP